MLHKRGVVLWLLVLLASVPTLLLAFLGQFSRIMGDDWCFFATALHLGGRDHLGYWLNGWHSSFTYIILHDVLAPLGPEYVAQVFPAIVFALWLIGLTWLILQVLRGLQLDAHRLPIAFILALLTLAAFVKGGYDWEAIYWYSAGARHSLPVGIFMIFLAMAWEVARARHVDWRMVAFVLAGAVACFVNAGLSQLQALIQLILLTLLMAGIRAFIDSPRRGQCLMLYAAGWIGSAVGLIAQLFLPGSAARMEEMSTVAKYNQIRSLSELLVETAETSARFIGHPGSIAGFMLLFAASLVTLLLLYKPKQRPSEYPPMSMGAAPLLLGMIVQLCFVPILWTRNSVHISDPGRFSADHAGILGLNVALIVAYLVVFWRREQLEAMLKKRQNGALYLSAVNMLGVLVLLSLTQVEGLHFLASGYLFVSALVLLGILVCQLAAASADARSRRFGLAAVFFDGFGLLFSRSFSRKRTFLDRDHL